MNPKRRFPDKPARCTACKATKAPSEFQKTRYGTLASWCNACKNAATLQLWHQYKPGVLA